MATNLWLCDVFVCPGLGAVLNLGVTKSVLFYSIPPPLFLTQLLMYASLTCHLNVIKINQVKVNQ